MHTPSNLFYEELFEERVKYVKKVLGNEIPLCYSIKANPFLLNCLHQDISKIEVCSPGELHICQDLNIPGDKIIYSGVMKENADIEEAIEYNVAIITAESKLQVQLENEVCIKKNVCKKVILRLTSGNQFGMSKEVIKEIISTKDHYLGIDIVGLHYYSGTQKKVQSIEKDLMKIDKFLIELKDEYGFEPMLIEYGPGLSVEYYKKTMYETENKSLVNAANLIKKFRHKYPVGIEMGRFLASDCGVFITQIKDIKYDGNTNYVICDGGIHHLKYYGQNMAMLIPPIMSCSGVDKIMHKKGKLGIADILNEEKKNKSKKKNYCICGSLCTTADVLVRNVELEELSVGDYIAFGKCGAYSVTEGISLFLSRDLPAVYIKKTEGDLKKLRNNSPTYLNNISTICIN